MRRHRDPLTEYCPDTWLYVGGMTGTAAATARALLQIKSTMLNHFHGAAFILWTYDCIIAVLSGVKYNMQHFGSLNMLSLGLYVETTKVE